MERTKNPMPWIISAALAIALGGACFSLNEQLQKKQFEVKTLSEKLAVANAESIQKINTIEQKYKSLLADSEKIMRDINAENDKKIALANQPEVQAQITFRKAFLHSGSVAMISNQSSETIAFNVEIERPGTDKTISREITLDRSQTHLIGEREGWAFISGDTIKITQPEHKTKTVRLE